MYGTWTTAGTQFAVQTVSSCLELKEEARCVDIIGHARTKYVVKISVMHG